MRIGSLLVLIVVIAAVLWYLGILDFRVNDAGELPNVTVEGGRAPDVDVDVNAPEVEVTTEERTVTVPQIDVKTPREQAEETAGASAEDTN
jgi:hypothetical protein